MLHIQRKGFVFILPLLTMTTIFEMYLKQNILLLKQRHSCILTFKEVRGHVQQQNIKALTTRAFYELMYKIYSLKNILDCISLLA